MNRTFLACAALAVHLAAPYPAPAQELAFPSRSIRLIVPSTPGSPPDVVARLIGERLSAAFGQPVVVDNRPGATGMIALQAVANAAPDGYTLGIIGMPHMVTPSLVARMPYDTEMDLAPVALINWNSHLLAVPAASPAGSVADLLAAAKARPGTLRFSSGGSGTPAHIVRELLNREAGVDMTHIPYKSAPAAVTALVSGEVDMMVGALGPISPHVKAGRLRVLATPAPQRVAAYPELPTFVELGYPLLQVRDWQGIVAPAGTRKDVIARLSSEIASAAATPEVKGRLEAVGMEVAVLGPEQFAAHIRSELRKWGKLARDAGIKAD
jgi:tripartite-type tricarboxylate transporter receptor subunit TctC